MIASIGHLFFLLFFSDSIFLTAQATVDTQLTGTWSTKSRNVSTGPVSHPKPLVCLSGRRIWDEIESANKNGRDRDFMTR